MLTRFLTTTVLAAIALAPSWQTPEPRNEPEVVFESAGAKLSATLLLPASSGPAPAVILVHGSGDSDRSNPWTSAFAEALVSRGIVVLHPDKRGCGKSEGDWKTASFELLADDAARGIEFLRARPEVDKTCVGLIGFSQGVHIAPVCAARPKVADFVIAVSGSVVPLLEQVVDEIELASEREGKPLSADQKQIVEATHRRALEFARSRSGWDELQAELARAAETGPALAGALRGLPRDREHWVWNWIAAVGDFDPMPHWKRVDVPMLFVYGGRDERVRVAKSLDRLRSAFAGTQSNWCAIELGLNGHALFRDDALDFAARWVRDRGAH